MTLPIITVCHLTKSYRLYARPADRLKEALMPWRIWHSPFHALHDVSFDVQPGEHLGILGINGAGKSTLLQILTGVLTPTSGEVTVRGRVAALLELGAGFNPQLTGRENVTFQLQLHNLPEHEIKKKTREVEAFADVGEFFDQPMKTYSSGMYVRVAFASAILTDPDILIIDEALAVGDARFQKKCYDQFNALKGRGTTVILVTHDIYGAKAHCSRLLLLHHGRLIADGEPSLVATQYYRILFPDSDGVISVESTSDYDNGKDLEQDAPPLALKVTPCFVVRPNDSSGMWGRGGAWLKEVRAYGLMPPNRFKGGQELIFECDYQFDPTMISAIIAQEEKVVPNLLIGLRLDSSTGTVITDIASTALGNGLMDFDIFTEQNATFRFRCIMPNLSHGYYFLTPGIAIGNEHVLIPLRGYDNLIELRCEPSDMILGLLKINYDLKRLE